MTRALFEISGRTRKKQALDFFALFGVSLTLPSFRLFSLTSLYVTPKVRAPIQRKKATMSTSNKLSPRSVCSASVSALNVLFCKRTTPVCIKVFVWCLVFFCGLSAVVAIVAGAAYHVHMGGYPGCNSAACRVGVPGCFRCNGTCVTLPECSAFTIVQQFERVLHEACPSLTALDMPAISTDCSRQHRETWWLKASVAATVVCTSLLFVLHLMVCVAHLHPQACGTYSSYLGVSGQAGDDVPLNMTAVGSDTPFSLEDDDDDDNDNAGRGRESAKETGFDDEDKGHKHSHNSSGTADESESSDSET